MAVFRELKHGKYWEKAAWAFESYLCTLLTLPVLGGLQASLCLFSFLFCCYTEVFLFMLNNEKQTKVLSEFPVFKSFTRFAFYTQRMDIPMFTKWTHEISCNSTIYLSHGEKVESILLFIWANVFLHWDTE